MDELERLREFRAELQTELVDAHSRESARSCYLLQGQIREIGMKIRDLEHPSTVPPSRWITPAVRRLTAGSAEGSAGRAIADGGPGGVYRS